MSASPIPWLMGAMAGFIAAVSVRNPDAGPRNGPTQSGAPRRCCVGNTMMRLMPETARGMVMNRFALVLAVLLAATAAQAETYADAYGLGNYKADPSKGGGLGDLLHISAALVKADGSPAMQVQGREVVRLSLQATRAADRASVKVQLRCTVYFTDANSDHSPGTGGICFDGEVGAGQSVPLNLRFKFRGSAKDPTATYGVGVSIWDEISGETVDLMPTWGWAGP